MKIFGHPVHIMLIHFPSALFPMDLVCSFIAYYFGIVSFVNASFYAMFGGVVLGGFAIITGTFDLLHVMKEKPSAMKKVLVHGGINTIVILGYAVLTAIAFKKYPDLAPDSIIMIIVKSALVIFMIVGNFFGGSLILKDKIAVKE
jgi:uncharacterized membrane protein